MSWHSKSVEETLNELGADRHRGLSQAEAKKRLDTYGSNQLRGKPPRSLLLRLLDQLRDPMILVLLAAAGLSLWSSRGEDWLDSVIILGIVVVNAVISISQENSAQRALEALAKMSAPQARVVREGSEKHIPAAEVVPGDLIHLEAGDLVPADARLLEAAGLKADESAMTGESVPVEKQAGAGLPEDAALGDRHNMVIGSTIITAGRATAVVVATGMDSEVGKVAGLLMEQEEDETPLQQRMGEISKVLSFVCLCVCAVMFGVGLIQGRGMLDMFMTAVSLAVAAIPEGLPAIVTIVLALGVQRMANRGAIVKKLPAVETLGCAGVICSDKTGTLTQNKMTVRQVWTPVGSDRRQVLTGAALCCDAVLNHGKVLGDPTEAALVEAALLERLDKNELERQFPRRGEIPFDSTRKLMSTVHPTPNGGWRVYVKGAPDVLLSRCSLSAAQKKAALEANDRMAADTLRVLGVAVRELDHLPGIPSEGLNPATLEKDLTFLGLVGMMDPPRPEVKAAVEECVQAGIRPVMITGDHKLTAVAVARELGICKPGDLAVTGAELDFMPQELLEQDVEKYSVYARVSPEHKTRIVNAWRKKGQIVAMTGDGVNDAPALKAAHIGCAMGLSGTDVAKEAADMILTDDNFATIVSAVAEGRGIYANIRKAIHYLLSCNIGEILTIFLATVLGFRQMPLAPVQLLWLNLVTDALPALALGVEPVEDGIMEQKPRDARESLFARKFSFALAWQGAMVGLLTLGAYFIGERVFFNPAAANTMAFATLTLCQLFHAFDVRSEYHSLFHIGAFSNPAMNKAFLVGILMQLAVLCLPPLQGVFQTVTLSGQEWLTVLTLAITPVVVCEITKAAGKRGRAQVVPHPAL